MPFSLRQTALWRQHLSRTYLAQHKLESVFNIISIMIHIISTAIIARASRGGSPVDSNIDADRSNAMTNIQAG